MSDRVEKVLRVLWKREMRVGLRQLCSCGGGGDLVGYGE
jgi:hypothetical protein